MNSKAYWLRPLVIQEVAAMESFTHLATFTANDLTTTTANTAQAITFGPIPAGSVIQVELRLTIPFKNSADAAFNSTTLSIGDGVSATSLLAAQQINENGTEVIVVRGALSTVYVTAENLIATFSSMAAKNLNAINVGQADLLVKIVNPNPLLNAKANVGITK